MSNNPVLAEFACYTLARLNGMSSVRNGERDYMCIAPVPHNEACTQATFGPEAQWSELECQVFARQLIRLHGQPPVGAELIIVENHHDAGVYYDVNVLYKTEVEDCTDWARLVEVGCSQWDEQARTELYDAEHPLYVGKVIQMKVA